MRVLWEPAQVLRIALKVLFALRSFDVQDSREAFFRVPTDRLNLVAANSCALLVHQVVSLGKEISDESTLDEIQALFQPLTRPRDNSASQQDAPSIARVSQMLHEAEIVELGLYATPDVASFSDVQGLKSPIATPAAKDIDTSIVSDLGQIEAVDHVLPCGVFQSELTTPLNTEAHSRTPRPSES
jgi:hypothetical protein